MTGDARDRTTSEPPLLPVREHVRRCLMSAWRDGYDCGYRRGFVVAVVAAALGVVVGNVLLEVLL